MKTVLKYYLLTVGSLFTIILIGYTLKLIGLTPSIFNFVIAISTLVIYISLISLFVYRLIQYFYLKILVIRTSFNWTSSIVTCAAGVVVITGTQQLNWLWKFAPSNLAIGIGCILCGLIVLPRFIKVGKDSITIYELPKRQIKYTDFINFNYQDGTLNFETTELKYEFNVFSIDLNLIERIENKIKIISG